MAFVAFVAFVVFVGFFSTPVHAIIVTDPPSSLYQIRIITPIEGQKLESDKVTVAWELVNFTLTDYATNPTPKAGQGHLHLWLDQANPTATNAVKAVSGNTYTFENVSSGPHTLIVELQNNDHTPFKPPIRQTINFETLNPVFINPQLPQNDFTLFLILVSIVLVGGLWYFLSPESAPYKPPRHKRK